MFKIIEAEDQEDAEAEATAELDWGEWPSVDDMKKAGWQVEPLAKKKP